MGRYNLAPLRVHQQASQLLETSRLRSKPPWYDVVGMVPPTQALVRTQPVDLRKERPRSKTKKASKLFKPFQIKYDEDELRKNFYSDHPWELARPRVVLEDDGKDGQRLDGSKLVQLGRPLDGECVVVRQKWLMDNEHKNMMVAYNQARREFYELRHREDVERRVAKEEAMATGAYFGKSTLEVGMELEDIWQEKWKQWAIRECDRKAQAQTMFSDVAVIDDNPILSPDAVKGSADTVLNEEAPDLDT